MIDNPALRTGLLVALIPLGALVLVGILRQFGLRPGVPRRFKRRPERNYGPDLVSRPGAPSVEP